VAVAVTVALAAQITVFRLTNVPFLA